MRRIRSTLLATVLIAGCIASSPSPSELASPDPSLIQSAVEFLDCDGPMSEIGGIGPFGIVTLGDTPQAALESWLQDPLFAVPVNDWEPYATVGDRAIFVYRNGEEAKVVAVFTTAQTVHSEGVYTLTELRTCFDAEYGPDAVFAGGGRVWVNDAGLILRDAPRARPLRLGAGPPAAHR